MTQPRLSQLSGVDRTTITMIEKQERRYNQDHLEGIARALGVSPADLLRPPPESGEDLTTLWARVKPEEKDQVIQIVRTFIDKDKARTPDDGEDEK